MARRILRVGVERLDDTDPDLSYLEQDCFGDEGRDRLEEYGNGWAMVGVRAWAEVVLTGGVVQRLTSGGLWGIESDSGEDYFTSVEAEQLAELRGELLACGLSARQIDSAYLSRELATA